MFESVSLPAAETDGDAAILARMVSNLRVAAHGERYGSRNSVGNGTKRLHNGSIRAVFPLFCRRNPSSLITGRFFPRKRWPLASGKTSRNQG